MTPAEIQRSNLAGTWYPADPGELRAEVDRCLGDKYYPTWEEFWTSVDWDYWERREDERCQNCFMHSGFEPSVVRKLGESWGDMWTMAKWQFLS